uniref:Uncharacterized protein n=1 Tax=Oryza sativa subsp. japonica TaxID=39947 RepID=Q6KA51_ORYSJ|nr:hypothetical protein [Oryza sativa Japonica Group]
MDSPATPMDFSPLHSLVPRNESCYTKEENNAISPVLTNATNDHGWRPATSLCGGGGSVDGGGGSPATGGDGEGRRSFPSSTRTRRRREEAAATAKTTARGGCSPAGDGGGLGGAAAALRGTRELGRWGKRKRATRGCYL